MSKTVTHALLVISWISIALQVVPGLLHLPFDPFMISHNMAVNGSNITIKTETYA